VAGAVGPRRQALDEAALAQSLGYDAVLLSLAGHTGDHEALVDHCRAVAEVMPVIGFYLQPAVGGRLLDHTFWRAFAGIPGVVAIKVAPFNRYQSLDVVRAVVEVGRDDVALYTGNDDNIVADLLTPFTFPTAGRVVTRYFDGGLLGQWAVWTRSAVTMLAALRARRVPTEAGADGERVPQVASWMARGVALTDANAAIFDARHGFAGCIAGIHEILRRQGLLEGTWSLDPAEALSPGQAEQIDRVSGGLSVAAGRRLRGRRAGSLAALTRARGGVHAQHTQAHQLPNRARGARLAWHEQAERAIRRRDRPRVARERHRHLAVA
jgi:hypothetical protein